MDGILGGKKGEKNHANAIIEEKKWALYINSLLDGGTNLKPLSVFLLLSCFEGSLFSELNWLCPVRIFFL